MADTRSPEQRRRIMRAVKTRNTRPEIAIRTLLFRAGYRYRLHVKSLPGTPDIVFSGRRKAIFVHGCFWHGHGCSKGQLPKSRVDYWACKVARNQDRDDQSQRELEASGWGVLVVWQCETKDPASLGNRLRTFLGNPIDSGS